MTESESVALPLGDTPISSYQYILADIADYIKHFLYLFQKIFNAGGARRRGGGGEDKATAPENEEAAPEGGAAVPESRATAPENRAAAPKTRRRFEDGAACRFPSPRRRGSGARRRGGDRFLYLFQKFFHPAQKAR